MFSTPKPQNPTTPAALSKWLTVNVLQAVNVFLFLLDWIPGRIFRKEVFRASSGKRIKHLWRIYIVASIFQIPTTVTVAAMATEYWFAIIYPPREVANEEVSETALETEALEDTQSQASSLSEVVNEGAHQAIPGPEILQAIQIEGPGPDHNATEPVRNLVFPGPVFPSRLSTKQWSDTLVWVLNWL
ncbi:hypothetical protein G7Y89_g12512 [Cudoniella acicularis]|uniref:Uncharacterized protein n=1 Tax=Cudoniella acicularis TaxID=354080 RepID=A0A8H4R913_9HELO|nr:hypothetical protein G7Y89_g12512 [Cudoniella acicularis]